jgi:hypothetical protein
LILSFSKVLLIVNFLEIFLNFFGLKIIRSLKHESKMTNKELLYYYEWALNINFNTLAEEFLTEIKKRNLIKK